MNPEFLRLLAPLKSHAAFRTLKRDAETGNIAHFYLIVTADTMLREALMRAAICMFYDGHETDFRSLTCRKVIDGTHADVMMFPEDTKALMKDGLERLLGQIGYAPIEASRRVFVIDNADDMQVVIQNKLLKTLEEPPEGRMFILLASSANGLIRTVLSRARIIEPSPLTVGETMKFLDTLGVKGDAAAKRFAAEASRGSMTEAVQILSDERYGEMNALARNFLTACKSSRDTLLFSDKISSLGERVKPFLIIFSSVVQTLIHAAVGNRGERVSDAEPLDAELSAIGTVYTVDKLSKLVDLTVDTISKIDQRVNYTMLSDTFTLSVMQIRNAN